LEQNRWRPSLRDLAETEFFPSGVREGGEGSRAIRRITPVVCAAAYPLLSQSLSRLLVLAHGSAFPDGPALWAGVAGSLLLAAGVMAVGFAAGRTAGGTAAIGQNEFRSRFAAHLAFATPSLFVGFGNIANLLHAPQLATIGWPVFWAAVALAIFAPAKSHPASSRIGPAGYRRLGIAHGISASAILVLFIAPHLANHTVGLLSGMTHIEIMKSARLLYRNGMVEPLLLTLIGFQIASGTLLVRRRLRSGSDFFGTLQSMTGIYVAIYLLAHLTAVFGARYSGTDTNWNWLTNNDHSMLSSLSNLRLIAHYWFGPVAIAAHLGCGARLVLREHDIPARLADFAPRAAIGAGVVVSTVILVALLGVHIN
jgi:hypothetical protein